jgi:hypothetical protein
MTYRKKNIRVTPPSPFQHGNEKITNSKKGEKKEEEREREIEKERS